MPKFLVKIHADIEVEAENKDDAEVTAAEMFDFGSVDFETEEVREDA
jgi:hypothetical protein